MKRPSLAEFSYALQIINDVFEEGYYLLYTNSCKCKTKRIKELFNKLITSLITDLYLIRNSIFQLMKTVLNSSLKFRRQNN